MINIVDAVIILLIFFGGIVGYKRGVVKQGVITFGTILVLIFSFLLKNPISSFMYKYLPFFKFDIIIKNATIFNIIIYEVISFLIVFSLLEIILFILIRLSSIVELLLKATFILEIPSKILGFILGIIESYIVIFIMLNVLSLPIFYNVLNDSKLKDVIVIKSPVISKANKKTIDTFNEIEVLVRNKDLYSSEEFNCKSLKIMIKNKFLSNESAKYLYDNKKINTSCGIR